MEENNLIFSSNTENVLPNILISDDSDVLNMKRGAISDALDSIAPSSFRVDANKSVFSQNYMNELQSEMFQLYLKVKGCLTHLKGNGYNSQEDQTEDKMVSILDPLV